MVYVCPKWSRRKKRSHTKWFFIALKWRGRRGLEYYKRKILCGFPFHSFLLLPQRRIARPSARVGVLLYCYRSGRVCACEIIIIRDNKREECALLKRKTYFVRVVCSRTGEQVINRRRPRRRVSFVRTRKSVDSRCTSCRIQSLSRHHNAVQCAYNTDRVVVWKK